MTYNHWTAHQITYLMDGMAAGKSYQKISEGLPFTGRDVTHKHFLLKCIEVGKKMDIRYADVFNSFNKFGKSLSRLSATINNVTSQKKFIMTLEKLNHLNPNKRTTRNQRLNNVRRMNPKFRG